MTDAGTWLDLLIAALLVVGATFALIGSIGLARFRDFYKRLHGPTKATTLGVGCALLASSLHFSRLEGIVSTQELIIAILVFLTAPISAQIVVKSAFSEDRSRAPPPPPAAPSRDDTSGIPD